MLTEERHQRIIALIEQQGIVKLNELVTALGASESTIRRDLSELEEKTLLKRIHGGATRFYEPQKELDMIEKADKQVSQKLRIAQEAARLIKNDECIYIDAGTTTLAMIHFITAENVTVVTNGLPHSLALAKRNITTYTIGGKVKMSTLAAVGAIASETIQGYHFDRAFIGANGIDAEKGYTTPDPDEAQIKRLGINLANIAYILADSSKINRSFFSKICDSGDATLITNQLTADERARLSQKITIIEG
ncbi:DeoR/GlpR family DNA-binding transcription regulator [Brochothrix thermosphacta]|uniref:DeoR/GlpR family DNA-binding transcription regulator n=1 Tax=Brochothrix thermosphacta TaxID=2756 RepID=UPI000D0F302C|nr:DeoR/GlpR family DNA-binding transcription regulator [Brochothrix thermosphacta]ANZ94711.1 DeoR family transcriptional regulator [Brochothrix thermosphacta]MDO7864402.1 DeoR/GlpR family DNA-binding transcription regulator [Brochothrix thermosphacta]SOC09140.1 transcriptional regulator (DeoR family) [Brochothrix thermosphacta]HCZ39377.1 DeoR/GlpR transcriptional regulator [Brochothrix thermosphacta]HCZ45671.1 DeoR/GlpR transcriptional regulator [Brochothrix thermosphacta]